MWKGMGVRLSGCICEKYDLREEGSKNLKVYLDGKTGCLLSMRLVLPG